MLREWAATAPPAGRVTLLSPFPRATYSGMVPGWIAGHYRAEDCTIPLEPLAARAGADFVQAEATAIDAAARRVRLRLADGRETSEAYDVLSVDIGGALALDAIRGAARHGLAVRPIERFVEGLDARLRTAPPRDVVVIGGGAGGFELATALRARVGDAARLHLVTGGPPLLASHASAVRRRALRALQRRRIEVHAEPCIAIGSDHVELGSGARIRCDLPVLATGTIAPAWLRGSGLALDADGHVGVDATLQSTSHPRVFAAGDVATQRDAPRPRSGVYAVRAGPPLARNLRAVLEGREPTPYRPQLRSLNLLSCGTREAIASWGAWSAEGRVVWWLKDRIDRRFVAAHRDARARFSRAA